jgi:hypothetical protein
MTSKYRIGVTYGMDTNGSDAARLFDAYATQLSTLDMLLTREVEVALATVAKTGRPPAVRSEARELLARFAAFKSEAQAVGSALDDLSQRLE